MKHDKHSEIVEQRAGKSATYRKTFGCTLHQIDLVREMREDAGLTQGELAKKVGSTQSVISRPEDAEYTGHSLIDSLEPFAQKLAGHQQLTDAYLLGLAIHKKGKLVTRDRGVRTLLPEKGPERDFMVLI